MLQLSGYLHQLPLLHLDSNLGEQVCGMRLRIPNPRKALVALVLATANQPFVFPTQLTHTDKCKADASPPQNASALSIRHTLTVVIIWKSGSFCKRNLTNPGSHLCQYLCQGFLAPRKFSTTGCNSMQTSLLPMLRRYVIQCCAI
jgi:hypothetical protein